MSKYYSVHVPQGRSAMLKRDSNPDITGVNSLFTNDFSSCVVISVVHKESVTLMHLDRREFLAAGLDARLFDGEGVQVNLYFREECPELKDAIQAYFKKNTIDVVVQECPASRDSIGGIQLAVDKGDVVVNFFALGDTPDNLIRHPQEKYFLTAHKIEQVIGYNARQLDKNDPGKSRLIYDGMCWVNIPNAELRVNTESPLTAEEMSQFNHHQTYVNIAGKLGALVKFIIRGNKNSSGEPLEEMAMDFAVWLEYYLNGFDELALFKKNMMHFVDQAALRYPNTSGEDDEFLRKLISSIKNGDGHCMQEVEELVQAYKQLPSADLRRWLLSGYHTYKDHYDARSIYRDSAAQRKIWHKMANSAMQKVNESVRSNDIEKARTICREVLRINVLSRDVTKKSVATAFFSLGRLEMKCGDFSAAEKYMNKAIKFSEQFDPDNQARHAQIKEALALCASVESSQRDVVGLAL